MNGVSPIECWIQLATWRSFRRDRRLRKRTWQRLDDLDLAGKRVLVRVDFNVPIHDGHVTDSTRIKRSLPTVKTILNQGGLPILISHLGRPRSRSDRNCSLAAIVPYLETIAQVPVAFCPETVGPTAEAASRGSPSGTILLLENLRFDPREMQNDDSFAASLARLGDVYCNDAFSASHRAHASITAIATRLPGCVGRLMEVELNALESALSTPERPVIAVIGGAKISTKLQLIDNLLDQTDILVVGGAMANSFHMARGFPTGRSLTEPELLSTAREILAKAAQIPCQLVLPSDSIIAADMEAGTESREADLSDCPDDMMILDIGNKTVGQIARLIKQSRTLVWNGPLGAFEIPPFDAGTRSLALLAAQLTRAGQLRTYAGGGDTVAALNHCGAATDFTYVSTAGGAFLEWMEGQQLPGIVALGKHTPRADGALSASGRLRVNGQKVP